MCKGKTNNRIIVEIMTEETFKYLLLGIACHVINASSGYQLEGLGFIGSLILGWVMFKVIMFTINLFKNL